MNGSVPWRTTAIRWRRALSSLVGDPGEILALDRTVPRSGWMSPTMWLIVTVLPAPEGPSRTVISPAGTVRSTPWRISERPKRLTTPDELDRRLWLTARSA